jgi:hypothetical protein
MKKGLYFKDCTRFTPHIQVIKISIIGFVIVVEPVESVEKSSGPEHMGGGGRLTLDAGLIQGYHLFPICGKILENPSTVHPQKNVLFRKSIFWRFLIPPPRCGGPQTVEIGQSQVLLHKRCSLSTDIGELSTKGLSEQDTGVV